MNEVTDHLKRAQPYRDTKRAQPNRNTKQAQPNRKMIPKEAVPENQKIDLIEKLIQSGQRNYGKVDLADMAQITQTPLADIKRHFRSTDEWIDAFYCQIVAEYRIMMEAIPDFQQYTMGEKLANFCFTSMDVMRDHEQLVHCTYHPFILNRFTSTHFERSVEELFREFTVDDNRIALSNQLLLISPVFTYWSREYLYMIGYWLSHPDSDEEIMVLVEKMTSLLNEILYNGVLDKTLDLGKFLIENGFVSPWTPVSILRRFMRF